MTATINPPAQVDLNIGNETDSPAVYLAYAEANAAVRRNADLVVMIVRASDLISSDKGTYTLLSTSLDDRIILPGTELAEDFPFRQQASCYSLGTGFFINEGRIATAAHVLFSSRERLALEDFRFIRDVTESTDLTNIQPNQIFRAVADQAMPQLEHEISMTGADWAVVEVEPLVEGTLSLPADQVFELTQPVGGMKVYSVGHGLGTGRKISGGTARVLVNDRDQPYFECDLPLFASSSGSPVFCADDHRLIGMVVRATAQIRRSGDVLELKPAAESALEGQECQRLLPFVHLIKTV